MCLHVDSMNHPIGNEVICLQYLRRVEVCIVSNLCHGHGVALVSFQYCTIREIWAVQSGV